MMAKATNAALILVQSPTPGNQAMQEAAPESAGIQTRCSLERDARWRRACKVPGLLVNEDLVKQTRNTEITIEVEESVSIRQPRTLLAHCAGCQKQMRMIAANEAAMIVGLSTREVCRLVEDGQLHFIEDQNRLLFICVASLHQRR
jgi:hypothetical protein